MAMGTDIVIATGLSAVSIVLLAALLVVWVRNYLTFATTMTLGLAAFGAVMLLENVVAIYFFFSMADFYSGDPVVQQAVLVLRALQLVALVFLTYVTVR